MDYASVGLSKQFYIFACDEGRIVMAQKNNNHWFQTGVQSRPDYEMSLCNIDGRMTTPSIWLAEYKEILVRSHYEKNPPLLHNAEIL